MFHLRKNVKNWHMLGAHLLVALHTAQFPKKKSDYVQPKISLLHVSKVGMDQIIWVPSST